MPARFALTPDELNAFAADDWEQKKLAPLADRWEQSALSRLGTGFEPRQGPAEITQPFGEAFSQVQDVVSQIDPNVRPAQPPPAQTSFGLPETPVLPRASSDVSLPSRNAAPAVPTPQARPAAAPPSSRTFAPTTAEISGGGKSLGLTERANQIMSGAASAASWLGDQGAKALQAVLVTEGGMDNARGDKGLSAGPLQFYAGGGQLNNLMRELGMTQQQAMQWVEQNPMEAVRWAIGTPEKPGYLGRAIQEGIKLGLAGPELATYAQRKGQVSVSPERAGQNFLSLFGGGDQPSFVSGAPDSQASLSMSQFDKTLTAEEAYAACGPAAAARLAATYGNAIPLRVALDAAKRVGWTSQGGMNGIANQKKLLDTLGVPAELDTSADWNRILGEAGEGRTVTISTPGHYFSAQGTRKRSDGQVELYVGQSGLDLKGGKAWMTPQEIEARMGRLNGALFSDPSRMVAAGEWGARVSTETGMVLEDETEALGELEDAVQRSGIRQQQPAPGPLEQIARPFGEAFEQVGQIAGQVGGAFQGANEAIRGAIGGTGPTDDYGNLGLSTAPGERVASAALATARDIAGEVGPGMMRMTPGGLAPAPGESLAQAQAANQLRREAFPNITEPNHPANVLPEMLAKYPGRVPGQVDTAAMTPVDRQRWEDTQLFIGGMALGGAGGGNIGRIPRPDPSTPGGRANQTLLNMYGGIKTQPTAPVPSVGEEIRRTLVRRLTDRGVDLAEYQKEAQRAVGRPLTLEEQASTLRRLNPSGAAEIRVQNELRPAIQSVGDDLDELKVYLTHQDNIDTARAIGERVRAGAVDAIPTSTAALQRAEARLRGRQQYLDRLVADVGTVPPERIRAAENAVRSAERSVARAQTGLEATRAEQLTRASATGAQAAAERQFSGGLHVVDSEDGLVEQAARLGPERMARLEEAADDIWEYARGLLDRKLESGLIDQDTYNTLTRLHPHFSPTRIVDYLKDAQGIPSGKKITVRDAGIKTRSVEGTVRQREDPLASFYRLAHETEALAAKNEVAQAFLRLRDLTPDGALMIRKVADDIPTPRGFEKMKVFTDGTPTTYMMPDYIARAIKEEPVAPIPLMTPLMNLFRAVATQRNPTFLASNALVDAVTYILRSSSRLGGPQHAPRVVLELLKAYGDTFQGLASQTYRGAGTAQYIREGGAMAGFFSRKPEDAAKLANELGRRHAFHIRPDHVKEDVGRLVGQALTLKPVEAIGERIELAPRVAAMRLAERAGKTTEEAVLAGRTVTIDFSQGGTWAKTLNQVIPFFNVAMQSGAQLSRAFNENPRGFIATMTGLLAAPTVAVEAWNRSDPERARDYEDVPQYVKDAGIVFMLPAAPQVDEKGNRKPQYAFFPTREFSPFVVLTREAAGRAMGQEPRAWGELLMGTTKSVSPIQGESGAEAISTFVPLGVSTALQLATDKDYFRDRRIVSQQADEQASALSKGIAEALQKLGVEARPSAVEFGIRDIGAGVAGTVLAGSDVVTGRPRRDERIQSTPGVGGLIGRFMQDRTGERLSDAIEKPVRPEVKRLLADSGIPTPTVPATISVRNQTTGNMSPPIELRQQERVEYTRLMNQYLDDKLQQMFNDPNWATRPIQSRNKILEDRVRSARDYAERQIYSKMDPADRAARMQASREKQVPKPRP